MRWTPLRIVSVAALVEVTWIVAVLVAALYVPALTTTPGLEGEVGTGPPLREQLLAATGPIGGLVVGVLLGRSSIGYRWNRVGYSASDAGYYAAAASALGMSGTFLALAAFQFALTWIETGVFAPLVVGVVALFRLGGFVAWGLVSGFVTGGLCFLCSTAVASVNRA